MGLWTVASVIIQNCDYFVDPLQITVISYGHKVMVGIGHGVTLELHYAFWLVAPYGQITNSRALSLLDPRNGITCRVVANILCYIIPVEIVLLTR